VEEAIRDAVGYVIPVVEATGAIVIAAGVIVSFVLWVLSELRLRTVSYEAIRLTLGRFLALGLEFQLGADILGTAVSPSWSEIGKLGAIAGIRTVLNYFLAQDLKRAGATGPDDNRPDGGPAKGGIAALLRQPVARSPGAG
jgi:uncharacterized membrane protein